MSSKVKIGLLILAAVLLLRRKPAAAPGTDSAVGQPQPTPAGTATVKVTDTGGNPIPDLSGGSGPGGPTIPYDFLDSIDPFSSGFGEGILRPVTEELLL